MDNDSIVCAECGQPIIGESLSGDLEKRKPCPKCGSEMVLRTAKQGEYKGEEFWGCSKYPKCNGTIFTNTR